MDCSNNQLAFRQEIIMVGTVFLLQFFLQTIVAPVRVRRTRTTRTRCVPVRTRFCVMTSGVRQTGAARNKQL